MKITFIIIGVILLSFLLLSYIAKARLKKLPLVENHKKIITLTPANFQNQVKNKVVLVDFWASWCAPCRMIAPILNDLAEESKGDFYVGKVNIEEHQALAQKYKVRSIPTLIIFKNGKEAKRLVGVKNKEALLKELQNIK